MVPVRAACLQTLVLAPFVRSENAARRVYCRRSDLDACACSWIMCPRALDSKIERKSSSPDSSGLMSGAMTPSAPRAPTVTPPNYIYLWHFSSTLDQDRARQPLRRSFWLLEQLLELVRVLSEKYALEMGTTSAILRRRSIYSTLVLHKTSSDRALEIAPSAHIVV